MLRLTVFILSLFFFFSSYVWIIYFNCVMVNLQVKGMITDFGEDMNCQFLEILRSLLDSYTLSGSQVLAYHSFSCANCMPYFSLKSLIFFLCYVIIASYMKF